MERCGARFARLWPERRCFRDFWRIRGARRQPLARFFVGTDRPHQSGHLLRPVLWGRSMGAAIAIRVAALDHRLAALVLESPMVDLQTSMAIVLARRRLPCAKLLARADHGPRHQTGWRFDSSPPSDRLSARCRMPDLDRSRDQRHPRVDRRGPPSGPGLRFSASLDRGSRRPPYRRHRPRRRAPSRSDRWISRRSDQRACRLSIRHARSVVRDTA